MALAISVWAVAIPKDNNNDTQVVPNPVTPRTPSWNGTGSNTTFGNVTVDYIDVGQGDSELITTPDNKTILIDTGPPSAKSAEIAFLQAHTGGVIDDLVLTHPDADHLGNAVAVLDSFTIKAIYYPGYLGTTQTYLDFMAKAQQEGCPFFNNTQVHAGDYLNWSSALTFRVMAIDAHANDSNDASIVLRMTEGSISYLFEGDASSAVEDQMVAAFGTGMEAQILKVGHHGSSYSTSDVFLNDVAPKVGVIEVGAGNTYGHPTNATLDRLAAHDVAVYRTDLNGTVQISSNGTRYSISVERGWSGNVTPPQPTATSALINEVESNPAGNDIGAEWVELYDPSNSSIDLSGWTITAQHSTGHSCAITSGTAIAAHGYYVVVFPAQFLDNTGEIVVLYDAGHSEVDRTPALNDTANDGMTWQRVPNGTDSNSASDWQFSAGTMGGQN